VREGEQEGMKGRQRRSRERNPNGPVKKSV